MRNTFNSLVLAGLISIFSTGFGYADQITAEIDISSQTMTVRKDGITIHRWKVSTARRGYHTPRGQFRPTRLHKIWYSRKYDMTPMPYSIFFYHGYAIHGTYSTRFLGRPVSHGCVRLDPGNAKQLFSLVSRYGRENTRIIIEN
jgi:lipoprotein-anchoring transpeptidase ErfK/SrfK